MSYKENIEQTLRATGRRGVEHVMAWLDRNRFYEVPASVKFHNNFPGGLAKHSWEVYQEALKEEGARKKPSMSLKTSFGLSLKNLISKKGR